MLYNGFEVLSRMTLRRRRYLCSLVPHIGVKGASGPSGMPLRHVRKTGPCFRRRTTHNRTPRASTQGAERGTLAVNTSIAVAPCQVGDPPTHNASAQPQPASYGLLNLCRAAACLSSHGMPETHVPRLSYLLAEAKGDIGQSYHTRDFAIAFDHAAYGIAAIAIQQWLMIPLGSTGLPLVVDVITDGVTVGKYYSRARDNV